MRHHVVLLLLFFIIPAILAEFTPDFTAFIRKRLGHDGLKHLERVDMGRDQVGSFGGRTRPDEVLNNRPVVFVHGETLRASSFAAHRAYLHEIGDYAYSELYATTYGDGGVTPMYSANLTCEKVKQVRIFIQTVVAYTNSSVDVIAYSLGVAISRKAILGGRCVDTGEDLGPPLTADVRSYVSVGGVARGFHTCPLDYTFCNKINGASCDSTFMRNINKPNERYEGRYSFSIYSTIDYVVGQKCCGHHCSIVKHSSAISKHSIYDHVTVLTLTMDLQLQLVQFGDCRDFSCNRRF